MYYREFKTPELLTEEDWRTVKEFEGIMRETSLLTEKNSKRGEIESCAWTSYEKISAR